MKVVIVALLFITITFNSNAQEKIVETGNQQWIQYYTQIKLSNEWTLLADAGFRWKNEMENKSQYVTRLGMGYQLHQNIRVAAGVGFFGYYTSDKRSKMELRPYQEILFKHNLEEINVQHRLRIEQRFFSEIVNGEISGDTGFNWRFRYSFNFTLPLIHLSGDNLDKKLLFSIGDEIFINAGKEIVTNVFDQNRVLIGPVLQLNENLSVSLIYNAQFAATTAAGAYKSTNVFWLGIKHNFDFTNNRSALNNSQ